MSNKTYDIIKNISLLAAPVIVFISGLVATWHVPYAAEITATLAGVDAMLGALTVAAKKIYDKKKDNNSPED